MAARSFCTSITSSDSFVRVLREARSAVPSAAAGLVFVSGGPTPVRQVSEQLRTLWKGVPTLIIPGAGVLHERGEVEGSAAASGLLWSNGKATPFAMRESTDDPVRFGNAIGAAFGSKASSAVVFVQAETFDPETLEGIAQTSSTTHIFGAGTVGKPPMMLSVDGDIVEAPAVGLGLSGMARPITAASGACRLLSKLEPIEEVSAGLVMRMGGQRALDLLSRCTVDKPAGQEPPPVVFAALSDPQDPAPDGRTQYFIRPIRGIDTTRRGIMVGNEARPGIRMAFAVRDPLAGRTELDATARFVAQNMQGSAPNFGIYLTCAGRGQNLYGTPDVEARILRQRFGELPIAGMHSAFEISPRDKRAPRLDLYTSVLAVFRTLS